MEFELTGDHVEVRDLAAKIFADLASTERVVQVEKEEDSFDRRLWSTLADSGMIGIAVPEPAGGAGLGMLGLVALLEQQGRRVAPVPLWSVVAGAALPIAEFASPAQAERWLPGLLDGTRLVTGGFDALPGRRASLTGRRTGAAITVDGEIAQVPAAGLAAALVVPVELEDGDLVVAVVPTDRAGVSLTPVAPTSRENAAAVRFDGVELDAEDVLPGDGAQQVEWVRNRIRVALAAVQLGVCAEALRVTAAYTSERMQFGRPLSTNQAVALRAADAHIDTEAIRVTTYRAAWLLDDGREQDAGAATLVAKWWASTGGLRAVHATQHLHGGIGADVDYPIHRYFLWGRQVAFSLGSAAAVAAELGDVLETAPAIGAPA
ncbi:acyl-CoA dehydrogenase family protein [Nocardioides sp. zg-DK7169]|uniref:acyl-CoA dehydrogenase family protein n=1 Tax=Nocardioides sp. zg-DK7169 TaxID=2736600 RepID=UPI001553496B|nr:acyl-CoA dehydrogenase family protein [Nocardioides sp. zg-DK7169]NPC98687.1 acyl-CoA/acyl-ACP dehydrogenase [Nocardioides sp. zg-DK7169]